MICSFFSTKPNPFYSQNKSLAFPVHYPTETIRVDSFLLFVNQKVSLSEGIFVAMPIKNLSLISLQTGALTCILENQEVYSKRLACVVGVEMGRG